MNVINGTNYKPSIGNFFDWLQTAGKNVSNTANVVLPVVDQVKETFGSKTGVIQPNTGIYPTYQAPTYQPPVQYQQPPKDNTMLYVGLGAAVIITIILLNKK